MIVAILVIGLLVWLWASTPSQKIPSRDWSKVPLKGSRKRVMADRFDRETREVGLTLFLMDEFQRDPNGSD